MSLGINLHSIVRPVINSLHPEVKATLYQSTGQTTGTGGNVKSIYAPGAAITAQMQSEGPTALYHADRVGMEEVGRKFYLFSTPELDKRIAGIVRPLSRGGDVFQLEDTNGLFPAWIPGGKGGEASRKSVKTWWLVDAILEDFTRSGWASVRATLQVNPPDFSNSEWGCGPGEYTP